MPGKAKITLTDGHILVGNTSNVATDLAMTGDVTIADTGATTIKSSVALAGSPTTTTQTAGDNSTKIATTAYVDTLADGQIRVGNASNVATPVTMSGDVTIADTGATTIKSSVALAGSPTTTTQTAGDNSTKIATTAYVDTLADGEIRVGNSSNVATAVTMSGDVTMDDTGATTIKSSVALAGSPTTTTQTAGDNSTKIATTAYADAAASAGGGAMVLLDTQTASSSASLDFLSSISSTYVQYVWILEDVLLNSSAGAMYLRVSTDNSTFITTNTYYYGFYDIPFSGGVSQGGNAGEGAKSAIAINSSIKSSSALSGEVKLITTAGSYPQYFTFTTTATSAANLPELFMGGGQNTTTSQVLGVSFYLDTGNIVSGKIRMYGIKAS